MTSAVQRYRWEVAATLIPLALARHYRCNVSWVTSGVMGAVADSGLIHSVEGTATFNHLTCGMEAQDRYGSCGRVATLQGLGCATCAVAPGPGQVWGSCALWACASGGPGA